MYVDVNNRRICTFTDIIEVVPAIIPMVIPAAVVSIIMIIPVGMISDVEMPVIWTPGVPVRRIVVPVPGGAPDHVRRKVYVPHQRPVRDLLRCSSDYNIVPEISGIGRFTLSPVIKNRLYDIIFAI